MIDNNDELKKKFISNKEFHERVQQATDDIYPLCPMCGNDMPLGGFHFGIKKVCRDCYEAHKDYKGVNK